MAQATTQRTQPNFLESTISRFPGLSGPSGWLAGIGLGLGMGAVGLTLMGALFWVVGLLIGNPTESMPFLPTLFQIAGAMGLGGCGFVLVYSLIERRVRTISLHTWRSAIRFRFFWVMVGLLLLAVVALPMSLKGDGTAEGLTQILITYTLSISFFFLGAGTLWMSSGTLAQDIEESHIQMIVIKPVARWQVWLGKWMGIMVMNLVLLGIVAVSLLGMVEYRAHKLTSDRLADMKKETDLAVFRRAIVSGIDVFQRDAKTLKILPSKTQQELLLKSRDILMSTQVGYEMSLFSRTQAEASTEPLLKPIADLRREVAGLEEQRLRQQVLIARAALPLEDVLAVDFHSSGMRVMPLDAKYRTNVVNFALQEIAAEEIQRLQTIEEMAQRGQKLFPPANLNAQERAAVTNRVEAILRIQSQVLNPGEGLLFRFAEPFGFDLAPEERLKLKLYIEDPLVNYTSSRGYGISYFYGPANNLFMAGNTNMITARKNYEIPMHAHSIDKEGNLKTVFGASNELCVTVFNFTDRVGRGRSSLKVPFMDEIDGSIDPTRLQVLYPEAGFTLNLLRSCGILFAWLGILSALGLMAASFMSFNVSAFACLGLLFVATIGGDTMKSVLKAGTIMNTYTLGERDSSILDTFAISSFTVLVPIIDTQKDYAPISNLANGQSTTWAELVRAYSYIWGITGWLLGLLGGIIFSRRQLAIHGAQAP